jgi:hypothetical protein
MRKVQLWAVVGISMLLVACAHNSSESGNVPTAARVKTLEDIKQAKAEGKPISEIDRCNKQAQLDMTAYENYMDNCVTSKLEEQGYPDGIDCIENFDNPVCDNVSRYNAEVNATNECQEDLPSELENRVTILDCMALVQS